MTKESFLSGKQLTAKQNGYELVIANDREAENPRNKYNLGKMIFFGDYSYLGDEHNLANEREFLTSDLWRETEVVLNLYVADTENQKILLDPISQNQKPVGRIVAPHNRIVYWFGKFDDEAMDTTIDELIDEVQEYNDFLNDNLLRFSVKSPTGQVIESVGGFSASMPTADILKIMKNATNARNHFMFDTLLPQMQNGTKSNNDFMM